MPYVDSVRAFNLAALSRHQLGIVQVPPNVLGTLKYGFPSFEEFMKIPAADERDSRNVACDPADYRSPSDPLTIGQFGAQHVLVDGYHRAVTFWKCGATADTIIAYVPAATF